MQNLLTSNQIRKADEFTLANEPISSINLMERAALAFVKIFKKEVQDFNSSIAVLCGPGDNGGDGLAIARLLAKKGYKKIAVYIINFSDKKSDNFKQNFKRLLKSNTEIINVDDPFSLEIKEGIIIDAILGSGLNKPLTDKYEELAVVVNRLRKIVIAVDVPTGFNSEGEISKTYTGIKANLTISFQVPKINFFFPESVLATDDFKVVDIGLNGQFIAEQESYWKFVTEAEVKSRVKKRRKFTHKGSYGHALLVAGNTNTMGAAILSAAACLNVGAGLTTVCLPQGGLTAMNIVLPEAMVLPRTKYLAFEDLEKFDVIAIGPGLGVEDESEYLFELMIALGKPLVIDADALTILSQRLDLLDKLPAYSVLTPHMKEFDRIFGTHTNWWQRVQTARKTAIDKNLIIVLKNQYTFSCLPTGDIVINSTGNPAMASGGMGDCLTGMIAGLIAQSYSSFDAAILATYLHGRAGDELANKSAIVTASKIAQQVPKTLSKLAIAKLMP